MVRIYNVSKEHSLKFPRRIRVDPQLSRKSVVPFPSHAMRPMQHFPLIMCFLGRSLLLVRGSPEVVATFLRLPFLALGFRVNYSCCTTLLFFFFAFFDFSAFLFVSVSSTMSIFSACFVLSTSLTLRDSSASFPQTSPSS